MEGGEVPFSFGDGSGGARRSLREELSRESRFGSFSRGGDRNSWGRFRSTAPAPPPPPPKEGPARRLENSRRRRRDLCGGRITIRAAAPDSAGGGSAA